MSGHTSKQGLEVSMSWVRKEVERADGLAHEKEFDQAIDVLERVIAMLRQRGAGHATLVWRLAVAHDRAGYLDQAFRLIYQAQSGEPGSPDIEKSRRIITRRLREAVAAGEMQDLRASYELLRDAGQADAACHLAMAQQLAEGQAWSEAERLLAALTTLHPTLTEAWTLRGAVATAQDDAELAATCAAMAADGGAVERHATQAGATA